MRRTVVKRCKILRIPRAPIILHIIYVRVSAFRLFAYDILFFTRPARLHESRFYFIFSYTYAMMLALNIILLLLSYSRRIGTTPAHMNYFILLLKGRYGKRYARTAVLIANSISLCGHPSAPAPLENAPKLVAHVSNERRWARAVFIDYANEQPSPSVCGNHISRTVRVHQQVAYSIFFFFFFYFYL